MMAKDLGTVGGELMAYVPRGDALELVRDNLGGEFDFSMLDRVKIPSGGGKAWEVPTLDGYEPQKTISGVIVHFKYQNIFWEQSLEEAPAGSPPDCVAIDGKHGAGMPGGLCQTCPHNQFGSADDGRGKKCRNVMLLLLQQPDRMLPIAVVLPPTSIRGMKKYLMRLTSYGIPFHGAVTEISLEQTKSENGITYSVAVPKIAERLPAEVAAEMAEYRRVIVPAFDGLVIDADTAGDA